MESKLNNCLLTLQPAESFIGQDEVCDGSTIIAISIIANKNCTIVVKQTNNRTRYPFVQEVIHLGSNLEGRYQVYTNAFYCHVEVTNTSVDPVDIVVSTRFLDIGKDFSASDPLPVIGEVVVSSIVAPLPAGTNTIGNVVVSSIVAPLPAGENSIGKVLTGENTDFAFFPDATNLTSAIYADGNQPVATNQAGWVYTNSGTGTNKINWYVFQDVTLPQYLVSEMDSIYFVISQLTPATTLPFVAFYTMPNGINDVVPNFAKSKLVFAPSGSVPTAQGEYLFYVKSDPTHIRPEITNRYELTFSVANSSKTLEQASNERLSLSTLSTNSTDPAGSNYFLFQQYGIVWEKTSVNLPVNNGKVECNVTLQPVSLATGTADIGFVNLKAENLLSDPATFSNLQINGTNLMVEDQQAITFLGSIDDNSNSIRLNTDILVNYNQSMDTNLGIIKNSNNGIETLTDSINSKITACNTGAVVLATGYASIGSVINEAWDSVLHTTKILNVTEENRGGPFPIQQLETIDYNAGLALTSIATNTASSNGASTKTLSQTGQNWTAGSSTLQSLTLSVVGGSQFDYVKLYNKATAPDQNDTPVMTIPVHTDITINVETHGLLFNLGIGVRATNDFIANDNTAPSGTIYATAFYKLG